MILFNTLYFVSLPVGQVKPKNNLREEILACLEQAGSVNFELCYNVHDHFCCFCLFLDLKLVFVLFIFIRLRHDYEADKTRKRRKSRKRQLGFGLGLIRT